MGEKCFFLTAFYAVKQRNIDRMVLWSGKQWPKGSMAL